MALNELHWAWQVVIAAMLVVGGVFALVGAVGMLRFPDFYMRMHAPTKATTLGVGGVLVASMAVNWARGNYGVHELLITLFLFITAPVSANLMAKAALHLRSPSKSSPWRSRCRAAARRALRQGQRLHAASK
ncbi:MAG: Na+/H+ antiporter subunit G [Burkholderiaceae bacterium]|nr:Na+/H+ antiporter subunit G [Burkholderiaceae bacterium]